jgi:hypothetical protein
MHQMFAFILAISLPLLKIMCENCLNTESVATDSIDTAEEVHKAKLF